MNTMQSLFIVRSAFNLVLIFVLALGQVGQVFAQSSLIYVKSDAAGANNGTSWANAYTDLQSALAAAVSTDEIWIAAGEYKPTSGTDRTATFTLKDGVAIYGGFAGTETLLTERDPVANVTILSGDIGIVNDVSDNSYHVVTSGGTVSAAVLDGITITAGNANGTDTDDSGGGLRNDGGSLTMTNVIITANTSEVSAGGIYHSNGTLIITGSTISDNNTSINTGGGGGGIFTGFGVVQLSDSTVSGNTVTFGNGGGIENHQSTLTVINSTFSNNSVNSFGGGIFNNGDIGTVAVSNSTFSLNNADRGGAIYNNFQGVVSVTNSTLAGNSANPGSGVVTASTSTTTMRNTIVANNPTGVNCSGAVDSASLSNLSTDGTCGTNFTQTTSAALNLGALANNGGPTQTIALGAGSVAIDAGDDATCAASPVNNLDQRSVIRPQGAHCDIGAYEQESALLTDQTITVTTHAPASATNGSIFTVAATASSGLPVSYSSSGACTNTGADFTMTSGTGTCTVMYDQAGDASHNPAPQVTEVVTAQPAPPSTYTLTVALAGTGSGTVTSSPAGIDCGADCSESYADSTVVTLTTASAIGSTFTGWTGAGCSGTGTCTITMNAAKSITATFTPAAATVTVALAGTGSGTVTSSPAGIDCGVDCSETYGFNTVVTLTAAPAIGSTFTGWSGGGCSGTGTCNFTINGPRTVTATFTPATATLTVALAGTGSGTVTSSPAGIDCGVDCSESYPFNTVVNLTAAPAIGSTFTGWTSPVCSGTGTCTVTMNAARSATATFTLTPKTNQTITVNTHAPASARAGDVFTVEATSSSGLPVLYTSSGVCTNVDGNFTMNGLAGNCTVRYDQAGNENYNPAPQVSEVVTYSNSAPVITEGDSAAITTPQDSSFTLELNATDADNGIFMTWSIVTPASHGTAQFVISPPAPVTPCAINQVVCPPSTSRRSIHYVPTAGYSGTDSFSVQVSDGSLTDTITVNVTIIEAIVLDQTITVDTHAPASAINGSSFTVAATASSGLPVSYSSFGACTNVDADFTMTSDTGDCRVMYDQAGDANYHPAPQEIEMVTAMPAPNTRYVSTSGFDSGNDCSDSATPCASISHAISQAVAGNTIEIAMGTYTEGWITVNKDLTLTGAAAILTYVQAASAPGTTTNRVFQINDGVTVSIENMTIRNGMLGISNEAGTLTLNNSIVSGNNHSELGGIINGINGTLTLNNSKVAGNSSGNGGGGIYNDGGTLILNNSTVSNNSARVGGGLYTDGGTVTILGSTFSGNSATSGGGVYNNNGTVTSRNSTFSGNNSTDGGAGIDNGGTLNLNYSTVANNTSDSDGDATGDGGGIYNDGGTVSLKSSIVAGNQKGTSGITDVTADCSGLIISQGYNLTGDGTGCNLSNAEDVTVTPANVFIGVMNSLADDGSATQTHALVGSFSNPALNAIPSGTNDCGATPFDLDQRGEARPFNTNCDIGAFEAQAVPRLDQTITILTGAPANAHAGDVFTVEATASSGLPVTYSAKNGCTNHGATFTVMSGAGACTVVYFQGGDENYNLVQVVEEVMLINSAPVITEGDSIAVTMSQDGSPIAFALALNATDADSAVKFVWSIATPPLHGTASVPKPSSKPSGCPKGEVCPPGSSSGISVNYVPTTGYTGTDSFEVQVSDGDLTDTITVNVTIEATVLDQTIEVTTNAPASARAGDVFTVEATATSGLPVSYSSSGSCTNVGADFTMTSGTDTCSVMYDQPGDSNFNPAPQVVETVTGINSAPVITEGNSVDVTMSEDGSPLSFSLTLNATDADGDSINWSISIPAGNGTASASGTGSSKSIIYSPNPDYNGSDSFEVRVDDGNLADTITVNVTINSVNDAPAITEGESVDVTMSEDSRPTPFTLTLNATDADSDVSTLGWNISFINPPGHGNASVIGSGASTVVSYIPTTDYYGSDSFDVEVNDSFNRDTITVNVTIEPVNDSPTDIALSAASIDEGLPAGTTVGSFTTSDPDTADTHSYGLVDGGTACPGTGNGSFSIDGSDLKTGSVFDASIQNTYVICVRSTDSGAPNAPYQEQFTITVNDVTGPQVSSAVRADTNPTSAASVDFTVTFSESVTGVDADDFTLTTAGVSGAAVSGVSGTGAVYTVTVNTGTGNGTIRLDVVDDDSIVDAASNPLTGGFTTGESYDVDKGNSTPPSRPTLVSPAGGSLTTDYTPLLDWNDSTVPAGTVFDHYQLQVAIDSAFASITLDVDIAGISNSAYTPPGDLASNTRFYWRVRAFNANGDASAWSLVRNFRTALLPPTLLAPDDAEQLANSRPTFDWDDVPGATGYRIEISSDSVNFSSPVTAKNVTPSTYTQTIDLPLGATLYWRVQSRGTNGPSAWSEVRSMTTASPPSAPTLASPGNNTKVSGPSPLFDWNDSTLPAGTDFDHYQIQIATDSGFTSIAHEDNVSGITNSQDNTAVLAGGTTYYWRVRAFNTLGQSSAWSVVRTVKIKFAGPTLTLPGDGSPVSSLMPTFTWDAVSGATAYTIQVSKNSTFAGTKAINTTTTAATYTHGTNLESGTIYYWRVRVKSPTTYAPGDWSEVFTFTTP